MSDLNLQGRGLQACRLLHGDSPRAARKSPDLKIIRANSRQLASSLRMSNFPKPTNRSPSRTRRACRRSGGARGLDGIRAVEEMIVILHGLTVEDLTRIARIDANS